MEEVAKKDSLAGISGISEDIRQVLVTDWDIEPEWHVRLQAVF